MEIKEVAVIGAGLMGTGITQAVAEAGYPVKWVDLSEEQLKKSETIITNLLNKKLKKNQCNAQHVDDTLNRITQYNAYSDIYNVDLVIEAVPENLDLKKKVFRQLDESVNPDAVLASNTSSLSIAALGGVTKRPEQVIGAHFFFPVPKLDLLEIIPNLITSKEVFNTMMSFAKSIGKTPVECNDYPGFIVNRVLIPMVNEAIYLVMEGVKPEDVDDAMKIGANQPMGPITLADFVGLETLLATMEGLYEGFKDSKYRPCPLLVKMVESGSLGRKTGRGFYQYNEMGEKINNEKGETIHAK